MRWRLDGDDGGQAPLLAEEVERHIGTGEYRGMEFLHVRARRIINQIPAAARLPFRYTINAYRGCSHACTYCAGGETPILMGDGRTKPLAEVRVGDVVYGSTRSGNYRRYVPTPVLDHWSTCKPAYSIVLADGTNLVASGDHRFLTSQGWKHVVGRQQGGERRPHLTLRSTLLGTGGFARPPEGGRDYRAGYLRGMVRGDVRAAVREHVKRHGRPSLSHQLRLALTDVEVLRRTRQYLAAIGVSTGELVLQHASGTRREMVGIRNQTASGVAAVVDEIGWPQRETLEWSKGFLAGIFDAEGSHSGVIHIANCDDQIVRRTVAALDRLRFRTVVERTGKANGLVDVRIRGGLRERLRFFHTVDPAISRKRSIVGEALRSDAPLQVVAVEPLTEPTTLYDMTTGTGDFIAEGVVSHNCFARPTHEYLDLDAGEDFERRIVVKINAVERLRAELAPGRWAGEPIAMGTNTDPYQRCEAKYHLTRGIVTELARRANPFSILTKSTLVLRDLDLLAEAAKAALVTTSFSIGTLDEEVWRTTEPGTPHPRRRLDAVARLNDAGVPCGVLVAPILPGLSDRPDQLEAVVEACVEAGARTITPILLHLRPGVREHYLAWLATAHPDLLAGYEARYARPYLPSAEQARMAARVADLVARFGGLPVGPRRARSVHRRPSPPPGQPGPARPRQLGLGI